MPMVVHDYADSRPLATCTVPVHSVAVLLAAATCPILIGFRCRLSSLRAIFSSPSFSANSLHFVFSIFLLRCAGNKIVGLRFVPRYSRSLSFTVHPSSFDFRFIGISLSLPLSSFLPSSLSIPVPLNAFFPSSLLSVQYFFWFRVPSQNVHSFFPVPCFAVQYSNHTSALGFVRAEGTYTFFFSSYLFRTRHEHVPGARLVRTAHGLRRRCHWH
jgi:hypothetical protein